MAASVRIEDEAFSDSRIEVLGALLGTSRYDAMGRLAYLWRQCTAMGVDHLAEQLVALHVDVEKLLASGLGERTRRGDIRLKGAAGRVEWLEEKRRQGRENGKKGAEFGKLGGRPKGVNGETPTKPGKGVSENPPPAPAPAPAQDQNPERSPARARSVGAGVPVPDAGVEQRRQHAERGWARFGDMRRRVAADLGEPLPRELHPLDPGRAELQARLDEAGPTRAEADLTHVLGVLEAEAIAQRTLRWLDGGAFRADRWSRAIATSIADAARPRGKAKPERDVRVGRIEPHAPSAYPDGEVTL